MATEYYQNKASVEAYVRSSKDVNGAALIKKLEEFLPKKSSLLEIGSGPGTDWRILRDNYEVIGSDNSEAFINHLKLENPLGSFLKLDAISLETEEKFDGIYTNKVLHHLKDEELTTSIKRQHNILTTRGIICHSFWKGKGSEFFKEMFINYHSSDTLLNFFEPYFEILLLSNYKEFDEDDSILLIGRKR